MDKKKKKSTICCPQETHFNFKDPEKLKVKGQKNIFHANVNQKVAGIPMFISDKTDFNPETGARDKGGQSSYNGKEVNSLRR